MLQCCHNSVELCSSSRSALTDHGKGKKHLDSVEKVKNFFTPFKTKNNQQFTSGTLDTLPTACFDISSLDSTQKKNGILIHKLGCNKSWDTCTLTTGDIGFSVRTNDDISDIFSTMFCDSPKASELHMARTKNYA